MAREKLSVTEVKAKIRNSAPTIRIERPTNIW